MLPQAVRAGGETHAAASMARQVITGHQVAGSLMPTDRRSWTTTDARCCSLTSLNGALQYSPTQDLSARRNSSQLPLNCIIKAVA